MMNENSPICARPMPTHSDVRRSRPPTNVPKLHVITLPTTTSSESTTIGTQNCTSIFGSISMPMVTKKIALNMSRSGATSSSILCSCRDSAITAPIKNAPSATE